MKVTVEIPESPKPADDFSGWTTKSISSITDAVTPSGNNQAIGIHLQNRTTPYVEMDKDYPLQYS